MHVHEKKFEYTKHIYQIVVILVVAWAASPVQLACAMKIAIVFARARQESGGVLAPRRVVDQNPQWSNQLFRKGRQ